MLKNNIHTKLVSASVLGVMLFLMLFSFYYNYDFFKKSSINIIESNHTSNLNFTDADDSRGFLFITEKEELEFREKDTIITFLTARSEDYSQVAGFEVGADDYIAKPIKPKLLVSKVKGLLRRLKDEELENSETLTVGNLQINREEYKIIKDGITIVLPRKEFELLYLLASKPGKVFTRAEILDKVWGNEVIVGGRTIDVHIRKLREKIDEDVFKTIKCVGYKIELNGD
mgnify:CR=1 FL=1